MSQNVEQIVRLLLEHDQGKSVEDICQENNISPAAFHQWKRFYAAELNEARKGTGIKITVAPPQNGKKRKYSKEEIIAILKEWAVNKDSLGISKKYRITFSTLSQWKKQLGGEIGIQVTDYRRHKTGHTQDEKDTIAQAMIDSGMTHRDGSKIYGVSTETLASWIRNYAQKKGIDLTQISKRYGRGKLTERTRLFIARQSLDGVDKDYLCRKYNINMGQLYSWRSKMHKEAMALEATDVTRFIQEEAAAKNNRTEEIKKAIEEQVNSIAEEEKSAQIMEPEKMVYTQSVDPVDLFDNDVDLLKYLIGDLMLENLKLKREIKDK